MPVTSDTLLASFLGGDTQAGNTLYYRHNTRVEKIIRREIKRRWDYPAVKELAHDTWRELFEAVQKGTVLKVGGWLKTTAIANAKDYLRKELGENNARRKAEHRIEDAMWLSHRRIAKRYGISPAVTEHVMRRALHRHGCSPPPTRLRFFAPQNAADETPEEVFIQFAVKQPINSPLDSVLAGDSKRKFDQWQLRIDSQLDLDTAIAKLRADEQSAIRYQLPAQTFVLFTDVSSIEQWAIVRCTTSEQTRGKKVDGIRCIPTIAQSALLMGKTNKQYRNLLARAEGNVQRFLENALKRIEIRRPYVRCSATTINGNASLSDRALTPYLITADSARDIGNQRTVRFQNHTNAVVFYASGIVQAFCDSQRQRDIELVYLCRRIHGTSDPVRIAKQVSEWGFYMTDRFVGWVLKERPRPFAAEPSGISRPRKTYSVAA